MHLPVYDNFSYSNCEESSDDSWHGKERGNPMKKFVFWSVLHKHTNIALTEDFTRYAQGETFWKAMQNLAETLQEWIPSTMTEESDINTRLKMYYETGINKVEILIDRVGDKYAVSCSNTRSLFEANSEQQALMKYVDVKAQSSKINTGDLSQI